MYLEIIDIRTGNGRKIGVGATFRTDSATRRAFDSIRTIEVPQESADFLVDLHDAAGNLIDTITINAAGFRSITKQRPPTIEESERYDRAFWRDARHYRDLATCGVAAKEPK